MDNIKKPRTVGGHAIADFRVLPEPIDKGILDPHIYEGKLIDDNHILQTVTWDAKGRCNNWQVPQYFLSIL